MSNPRIIEPSDYRTLGLSIHNRYNSYKFSDKWTKIGVNIGICLGNSHGNFQLHRFTTSENIAKSFRGGGLFFDSHCTVSG